MTWRLHEERPWLVMDDDGFLPPITVATVHGSAEHAPLIAAAPRMLELLRVAISECDHIGACYHDAMVALVAELDGAGLGEHVGAGTPEGARRHRFDSSAIASIRCGLRLGGLVVTRIDRVECTVDVLQLDAATGFFRSFDGPPVAQQHRDTTPGCPTCGMQPQVHGCANGKCGAPK